MIYCIASKVFSDEKARVITSGIFLIHPINVQSVVWVSSSRELIATFFTLIAAVILINLKSKWTNIISIFFWLMAILFKPIGILVPIIIPIFQSKNQNQKRTYFLLGSSFILILLTFFFYIGEIVKTVEIQEYPIINYFGSYVISTTIYLKNFFLPFFLKFNYSITPNYIDQVVNSVSFFYYLAFIFLLLTSLAFLKNRKYLYYSTSFLILITLNSGLIPFNHQFISTVTDRYLYLPSIALVFIITTFISNLRDNQKKYITPTLIVLLTLLSINEVSKWRSNSSRVYTGRTESDIQKASYINALIKDREYSKALKFLKNDYGNVPLNEYLAARLSLFNSIPKDTEYLVLRNEIEKEIETLPIELYPLVANFTYQNNDFALARVAYAYSKKNKNSHLVDFNLDTLLKNQETYEDKIMAEVILIPSRRRQDQISNRLYKMLRPFVKDKDLYDLTYRSKFQNVYK
ncbi:hypothetical protein [Halobacteriovorax marinus]|uniref:hypothetical protein n=1 Tax=Halobacteriovorax marinus TaxID=97084 RepID=UPI003A94500C